MKNVLKNVRKFVNMALSLRRRTSNGPRLLRKEEKMHQKTNTAAKRPPTADLEPKPEEFVKIS